MVETIDRGAQHAPIGPVEEFGQLICQGGLSGGIDSIDRHSQRPLHQSLFDERPNPIQSLSSRITLGHHGAQPTI